MRKIVFYPFSTFFGDSFQTIEIHIYPQMCLTTSNCSSSTIATEPLAAADKLTYKVNSELPKEIKNLYL